MSADGVTYTVKELLAIQAKSLERIERKVDEGAREQAKATALLEHRVTVLEQVPDLEPRVRLLESARSEDDGERSFKQYRWAALAALAAISETAYLFLHH